MNNSSYWEKQRRLLRIAKGKEAQNFNEEPDNVQSGEQCVVEKLRGSLKKVKKENQRIQGTICYPFRPVASLVGGRAIAERQLNSKTS